MAKWFILGVSTAALALALSVHVIGLPAAAAPLNALPQGYRDWTLISVAILGPPFNDVRAMFSRVTRLE
jgi:hypothetical protein